MKLAARELRFEEAARLRDQIRALQGVSESPAKAKGKSNSRRRRRR